MLLDYTSRTAAWAPEGLAKGASLATFKKKKRGKNGPRGKQKVKAASYSDDFFKTKPTLALAHVR